MGDREDPELAGTVQFEHQVGHGRHDHGNLSGKNIGDRRPGAAVGHVDEVGQAHAQLEGFGSEMVQGAGAGGAIGQLARIALGIGDQLAEIIDRQRRMHRQRKGGNRDAGNRLELFERIELRPVLEQRLRDMRGRAAEQQRVAIGSRARGLRCAE